MIIDCFTYNNEEEMLNFRLHELNHVVDKFVLLESPYYHQGGLKQNTFEKHKEKFIQFKNKIVHIVDTAKPHPNPWINEKNLRNVATTGLKYIKPSSTDYVGISDIDEIPDPLALEKLKEIKPKILLGFMHNFYYYNINCRKRNKWFGSVFGDLDSIYYHFNNDFNELRYALKRGDSNLKVAGLRTFSAGGWHFSYFGTLDKIIEKLESFTHSEYNKSEYKNKDNIIKAIREGKDLFNRGGNEDLNIITETYLPKYTNLLPNIFV